MLFSALLSSCLAYPTFDASTTEVITAHRLGTGRCIDQITDKGDRTHIVETANAATVFRSEGNYNAKVIEQHKHDYVIQIKAFPEIDANMMLALFVRNIEANVPEGEWSARVTFVDQDGNRIKKFTKTPDIPTSHVYGSGEKVLLAAYKEWPLCN